MINVRFLLSLGDKNSTDVEMTGYENSWIIGVALQLLIFFHEGQLGALIYVEAVE